MVERSIAWLVKANRRLRYRGTTKNHAWWQLRTAAVNLKRLLRLGLSNENCSWAIQ
ncbi:transposase [Arthrobacter sp. UYCu712]|uniref:transposase n=1 Tax=Arthrobacter sp. UYCu712 TaxID=3156340 RepID=UPI00339667FB